MLILKTTEALATTCQELSEAPFIAVDTEFMRERTYWSQLCLIQVAGGDVEAIIDPLADGIDLQPFLDLLADHSITKVFHAARQDLEIFFQLMGEVPAPLFDSQVAAMAAGYGDSVGYDRLVQAVLNRQVDKGSRFTDWARRPLSEKQLTYAMADVTHLRDMYPILKQELESKSRLHWLNEEMGILENPEIYRFDPKMAWKRMKLRKFSAPWLAVMRNVAEWRECEAQSQNRPRGRILKDDAIYELAQQQPKSLEALGRLRAIPNGFERSRLAKPLLAAIREASDDPEQFAPKVEKPKRFPSGQGPIVEMLKVLLKLRAETIGVAPRLIANVSDLEHLAADDEADIPALRGWRMEEFGKHAFDLKAGKVCLRLKGNRAVVENC